MVTVVASIITGVLTLIGVILTNSSSNKEIEHKLETSLAVTETKLENLTEEVRKHNNYVTRVPALEVKVDKLEKDVSRLNN